MDFPKEQSKLQDFIHYITLALFIHYVFSFSEANVTIGLRKVGNRDPEQTAFRSIKYETDDSKFKFFTRNQRHVQLA